DIPGVFLAAVRAQHSALTLRRELTIDPGNRWLVIAAYRSAGERRPARLEVRIGGTQPQALDVPEWDNKTDDIRPLAVALPVAEKPTGAKLPVEIRQLVGDS